MFNCGLSLGALKEGRLRLPRLINGKGQGGAPRHIQSIGNLRHGSQNQGNDGQANDGKARGRGRGKGADGAPPAWRSAMRELYDAGLAGTGALLQQVQSPVNLAGLCRFGGSLLAMPYTSDEGTDQVVCFAFKA